MDDDIPADKNLPAQLAALLALWDQRRAGRVMPARRELSVEDLKPWLGHLILLDVLEDGADFRYRLYGSRLVDRFGADWTGITVSLLPPAGRAAVLAEYRSAWQSRRPRLIRDNRIVGQEECRFAELVLPLSDDGANANMLLAGVYPAAF